MKTRSYPLESTFFGLTQEYRPILHREINQLVYHGGGGYTHDQVYSMPIWLRRFYIRDINRIIEEQNQKSKENSPTDQKGFQGPPDFITNNPNI